MIPDLNCFSSPIPTLDPLARMVLLVLTNARGFYRRDGMTCRSVAIRFAAEMSARDGRMKYRAPAGLGSVLARLRRKGLVRSERRNGVVYWRRT